jgi:hypothetical protein
MNERDWQKLLSDPGPTDAGFTLRVLAALPPPRRRRERLRTSILLLAAILAAVLMAITVAPALVHAASLTGSLLVCLFLAALAFFAATAVAD